MKGLSRQGKQRCCEAQSYDREEWELAGLTDKADSKMRAHIAVWPNILPYASLCSSRWLKLVSSGTQTKTQQIGKSMEFCSIGPNMLLPILDVSLRRISRIVSQKTASTVLAKSMAAS